MDVDERSQASDGQAPRKPPLAAGLHIVATPIGNMRDITLRALDVLQAADLIACEDTRVFAKLASHYGIAAPTVAYSDATQDANEPRIVRALAAGKRVALVSDAGMPLISDPGYRLVRAALAARPRRDLRARPLRACRWRWRCRACRPTVSSSAASCRPRKASGAAPSPRWRRVPATLVFFEAPHRLAASLGRSRRALGRAAGRGGARAHQAVRGGAPRAARASLPRTMPRHPDVKGEIAIVIGPPGEEAAPQAGVLDEALRTALAGASVKDAAAEVAARYGLKRRDVYARALELKREASS